MNGNATRRTADWPRLEELVDLDRYPLDRPDGQAFVILAERCTRQLADHGMFNLDGFVRPSALANAVAELEPLCRDHAFVHERHHNVYFDPEEQATDHPAMARFLTSHRTVCGDQLGGTVVQALYDWPPLWAFLARVMVKPALFPMGDPLARLNVIQYRHGETLNWHFDRSQYTTTLLLQGAAEGGEFEYRSGLRSAADPNLAGIARVLHGLDPEVRLNPLAPGTLNVFAGRDTLHRVTTVRGDRHRMIAVFSYYDQPDRQFSAAERIGFYGRAI